MVGKPSPQNPSISQLTLPPETIPSCYRRMRHTEFQPHSGRHLDVDLEALTVDRAIENPRCLDPIVAQCGQEGCGLPVAMRDFGRQPAAARRPAPQGCHVGLGPGLVDEDQALRLDLALILLPLRAPAGDVRTAAFAGGGAFF